MTLFHWRDSLSLDIPAIDDDHKQLIDLLNRLHFEVLAGADREVVGTTLKQLGQYVIRHFRREEMLMRLSGYPGYVQHKKMHDAMAERVRQQLDSYQAKPSRFDTKKLYELLADWLLVHISKEDVKLRPYIMQLSEARAA